MRSRRTDLRRLVGWCAERGEVVLLDPARLADLMEEHLDDIGERLSPGTVTRASTNLTALAKVVGANDAARGAQERRRLSVRATRKRRSAAGFVHAKPRLSKGELARLAQAIEDAEAPPRRVARDRAILAVMRDVLARRSEVAGLRLRDLDLDAGTLLIAVSKTDQGGRGERFSLAVRTVAAIREWIDRSGLHEFGNENLPLFVGLHVSGGLLLQDGQPDPMDGGSVARMLRRYGEAAGLAGVSGHTIRRTVARLLHERGVPEERITAMGRWSSLEQMREYVGLSAPRQGASDLLDDD